jgi:hypothetical protein
MPGAGRRSVAGRTAPPDEGTPQLRRRKIAATSRGDLPLDGTGVLYGRSLIDHEQFAVLTTIMMWLERLQRGWGGTGGCHGLVAVAPRRIDPQANTVAGLADSARRQLVKALRQLDGSRTLIVSLCEGGMPEIVLRASDG